MSFYLELQSASDIKRTRQGIPYAWRTGKTKYKFYTETAFLDFVQENAPKLTNMVAFTGSATLITQANTFLAQEIKKVAAL